MRSGLAVSAIAHAALIAWGVFSLPHATPLDTSNIEQIPVDFVEIADETKIDKGVKTAALVEEVPVPPKAEKVVEEPPPLPKPDPIPEPDPAPPLPPPPPPTPEPPAPEPPQPAVAPPPPPEAAPPPEPSPEAEAPPPETTAPVVMKDVPLPRIRPKPPVKPQPEPDTTKADLDQITALLDKRRLEQMAAAEPDPQPPAEAQPTVGVTSGLATAKMTANELDALRARLAECWTPPLGWTDPSEVRVVLMLSLNPDGSVAGVPAVLESPQGQYSNTAPESALRAVRRCAPYNLPADKYDAWKQVKVTFDPKDMGSG